MTSLYRHRLVWGPALVWTWLVREAWLVRGAAWLLVREASGSRVLLTFLAFRRIVFLH